MIKENELNVHDAIIGRYENLLQIYKNRDICDITRRSGSTRHEARRWTYIPLSLCVGHVLIKLKWNCGERFITTSNRKKMNSEHVVRVL